MPQRPIAVSKRVNSYDDMTRRSVAPGRDVTHLRLLPSHPPLPAVLRCRSYILVQAEHVLGIIFRLDLLKTPIVRSICCSDRVALLIVAQVVHVATRSREGLHGVIGIPRPSYAGIVILRIGPLRQHEQVVAL